MDIYKLLILTYKARTKKGEVNSIRVHHKYVVNESCLDFHGVQLPYFNHMFSEKNRP